MPDQIPQPFPEPDRDLIVAQYRRDFAFYADDPGAADEGSQADVDGSALADQLVPGYQQIHTSADNLVLRTATGAALDTWCASKGIPGHQPATSSLGYVVVKTSIGGTKVFADDELKTPGSLRFRVVKDTVLLNNQLVLVRAFDTGPSTNLPAGAVLRWTSPRPGCLQDAAVGLEGLTGGRLEETDPEVIQRVRDVGADPPGADNDARMRGRLRDAARALGIPLQAVFSYPCITGPGTTCLVFTVLPDAPGGSRAPTAAQRDAIEGWVKEQCPGDDTLLFGEIVEQDTTLSLGASWLQGAAGWADLTPWPPPYTGTSAITVTSSSSPTAFTLGRASGVYAGVTQPKAGQTIAFYDRDARTFVRKRIASFTGTGPWVITVATTVEVSDTAYQPAVGRRACPWSDSLALLVPPLLGEFDKIGPGEQVGSFYDEGRRQRRAPSSLTAWPSRLGNRVINPVQDLASVLDAQLLEPAPGSLPLQVTLGAPGVLSCLFRLSDLAAFPL